MIHNHHHHHHLYKQTMQLLLHERNPILVGQNMVML
jgi:hypothetical protein